MYFICLKMVFECLLYVRNGVGVRIIVVNKIVLICVDGDMISVGGFSFLVV